MKRRQFLSSPSALALASASGPLGRVTGPGGESIVISGRGFGEPVGSVGIRMTGNVLTVTTRSIDSWTETKIELGNVDLADPIAEIL